MRCFLAGVHRHDVKVTLFNIFFLFYSPCITIHSCSENQLDALFILSLLRQSTSTCFGHICGPSSGGILYIYSSWYVLSFSVDCLLAGQIVLFSWLSVGRPGCAFQLTVCWPARLCFSVDCLLADRPTDSQLKSTEHTSCCIYTVHLLMMGHKYAQNM